MTTARDVMTARINAALARYDEATADGTWRTTARNQALDHILQGWDKTVQAGIAAAIADYVQAEHARRENAARPLIQAVQAVSRA